MLKGNNGKFSWTRVMHSLRAPMAVVMTVMMVTLLLSDFTALAGDPDAFGALNVTASSALAPEGTKATVNVSIQYQDGVAAPVATPDGLPPSGPLNYTLFVQGLQQPVVGMLENGFATQAVELFGDAATLGALLADPSAVNVQIADGTGAVLASWSGAAPLQTGDSGVAPMSGPISEPPNFNLYYPDNTKEASTKTGVMQQFMLGAGFSQGFVGAQVVIPLDNLSLSLGVDKQIISQWSTQSNVTFTRYTGSTPYTSSMGDKYANSNCLVVDFVNPSQSRDGGVFKLSFELGFPGYTTPNGVVLTLDPVIFLKTESGSVDYNTPMSIPLPKVTLTSIANDTWAVTSKTLGAYTDHDTKRDGTTHMVQLPSYEAGYTIQNANPKQTVEVPYVLTIEATGGATTSATGRIGSASMVITDTPTLADGPADVTPSSVTVKGRAGLIKAGDYTWENGQLRITVPLDANGMPQETIFDVTFIFEDKAKFVNFYGSEKALEDSAAVMNNKATVTVKPNTFEPYTSDEEPANAPAYIGYEQPSPKTSFKVNKLIKRTQDAAGVAYTNLIRAKYPGEGTGGKVGFTLKQEEPIDANKPTWIGSGTEMLVGDDGSLEFTNLPEGTYTLTETKGIEGFTSSIPDGVTVTVALVSGSATGAMTVKIDDVDVPSTGYVVTNTSGGDAALKLTKTGKGYNDAAARALAGAKFKLYAGSVAYDTVANADKAVTAKTAVLVTDSALVATPTTSSGGVILYDHMLTSGKTFTLFETESPVGFGVVAPVQFTLDVNGTTPTATVIKPDNVSISWDATDKQFTLTLTDPTEEGALAMAKQVRLSNGTFWTPAANAVVQFEVYKDAACTTAYDIPGQNTNVVYVKIVGSAVTTILENGKVNPAYAVYTNAGCTTKAVLPYGTYYLKEVVSTLPITPETDRNYIAAVTAMFVVDANNAQDTAGNRYALPDGIATGVALNTADAGEITLGKFGSATKGIGALKDRNKGFTINLQKLDANGKAVGSIITKPVKSGTPLTFALAAGKYQVWEAAATGYAATSYYTDVYAAPTTAGNGAYTYGTKLTIEVKTGVTSSLALTDGVAGGKQYVAFVNDVKPSLKLTKKISTSGALIYTDGNKTAAYVLFVKDGGTWKVVKNGTNNTWTTGVDSAINFGVLEPGGEYIVAEYTVPSNYSKPDYHAALFGTAGDTIGSVTDTVMDTYFGTSGAYNHLRVKLPSVYPGTDNQPGDAGIVTSVEDKNIPARVLKLSKVNADGGAPLTTYEFGVYSDEACSERVGGAKNSTDFTDLTGANFPLEAGKTYYIKEISVDPDFELDARPVKLVVDNDGKVTLSTDKYDATNDASILPSMTENLTQVTVKFQDRKLATVIQPKQAETSYVTGNGLRLKVPAEGVEYKLEKKTGETTWAPVNVALASGAVEDAGVDAQGKFKPGTFPGKYVYDPNGAVEMYTGPGGLLTIDRLPIGEYRLTEVANDKAQSNSPTHTGALTGLIAPDASKVSLFSIAYSDDGKTIVVKQGGSVVSEGKLPMMDNPTVRGKIRVIKHGVVQDGSGHEHQETPCADEVMLNGKYLIYREGKDKDGNVTLPFTVNGDTIDWNPDMLVQIPALYTGTETYGGARNTALSDWLSGGAYWVREVEAPFGYLPDVFFPTTSNVSGAYAPSKGTTGDNGIVEGARRVEIAVTAVDRTYEVDFGNPKDPKVVGDKPVYARVDVEKLFVRLKGDGTETVTAGSGVRFDIFAGERTGTGSNYTVAKVGTAPLQTVVTGTVRKDNGDLEYGLAISRYFLTGDGNEVPVYTDDQSKKFCYFVIVEDKDSLPDDFRDNQSQTDYVVKVEIPADATAGTDGRILLPAELLTVRNYAGKGALEITKYKANAAMTGVDDDTKINGVSFQLYNDKKEVLAGDSFKKTTVNGVVRFTGLQPGKYYVKELPFDEDGNLDVLSPGIYRVGSVGTYTTFPSDGLIEVTVYDQGNTSAATTLSVGNKPLPGFDVKKISSKTSTGAAVEFSLQRVKNSKGAAVTEAAVKINATSANSYKVSFANLKPGTYELTESAIDNITPDDMIVPDTKVVILVSADGVVSVDAINSTFPEKTTSNLFGYTVTNTSGTLTLLTETNQSKGELCADKLFKNSAGGTVSISGATIVFQYKLKTETIWKDATYTNGAFTPALYLDAGIYEVKEKSVNQASYSPDPNVYEVTIENHKVTYLTNATGKTSTPGNGQTGNPFTNVSSNGQLKIWKFDENGNRFTYGSGTEADRKVTYTVYNYDPTGTVPASGKFQEVVSTADTGIATLDVPATADGVTYWVQETTGPKNYTLDKTIRKVTVKSNKTGESSFTEDTSSFTVDMMKAGETDNTTGTQNFPNGDIYARKFATDANYTGAGKMYYGVGDVELTLYVQGADDLFTPLTIDSKVQTVKTDGQGFAHFSNVPEGVYRIVESKPAPSVKANDYWSAAKVNKQAGTDITVALSGTGVVTTYPLDTVKVDGEAAVCMEGTQAHVRVVNPLRGVFVDVIKLGNPGLAPVDSAKYAIYNKNGMKPIKQYEATNGYATGSNGKVSFGPLELDTDANGELITTTFVIVELSAPGYAVNELYFPVSQEVSFDPDSEELPLLKTVTFINSKDSANAGMSIEKLLKTPGTTDDFKKYGDGSIDPLAIAQPLVNGDMTQTFKLHITGTQADGKINPNGLLYAPIVTDDGIVMKVNKTEQGIAVKPYSITKVNIAATTASKLQWTYADGKWTSALVPVHVFAMVDGDTGYHDVTTGAIVDLTGEDKTALKVEYFTKNAAGGYDAVVGIDFKPGDISFDVLFKAYPNEDNATASEITWIENKAKLSYKTSASGTASTPESNKVAMELPLEYLPVVNIVKSIPITQTEAYVTGSKVGYAITISNVNTVVTSGAVLVNATNLPDAQRPALKKPMVIDVFPKDVMTLNQSSVKFTSKSGMTVTATPSYDKKLDDGREYAIWSFNQDLAYGDEFTISYDVDIAKVVPTGIEGHVNRAYLTSGARPNVKQSNKTGAQFTEGQEGTQFVHTNKENGVGYNDAQEAVNKSLTSLGDRGKYLESNQSITVKLSNQLNFDKGISSSETNKSGWTYTENPITVDGAELVKYQWRIANGGQSDEQVVVLDTLPYLGDGRGTTWALAGDRNVMFRPEGDVTLVTNVDGLDVTPYYFYGDVGDTAADTEMLDLTKTSYSSDWRTTPDDTEPITKIGFKFSKPITKTDGYAYLSMSFKLVDKDGNPITQQDIIANTGKQAVNNYFLGTFLGNEQSSQRSNKVIAEMRGKYGKLGNYVWREYVDSGIQSMENMPDNHKDLGVQGVTVTLCDENGTPLTYGDTLISPAEMTTLGVDAGTVYTRETDANGFYLFDYLKPGNYTVEFDKSTSDLGKDLYWGLYLQGDTKLDSDANWDVPAPPNADNFKEFYNRRLLAPTKLSSVATVPYGDKNLTLDASLVRFGSGHENPNYLGDYFWFEEDGDGIQEDGLDFPLVGYDVYLIPTDAYLPLGTPTTAMEVMHTTTIANGGDPTPPPGVTKIDAKNGYYEFRNILPGDYVVLFTKPGDDDPIQGLATPYRFSPKGAGADPAEDSDVNTGGWTDVIKVEPDTYNPDIDAAITRDIKNRLGNTVWFDMNYNGKLDSDEWGVEGVTVTLKPEAAIPEAFNTPAKLKTTTDANGHYLFKDIYPGNYHIEFYGLPANGSYFTAKEGTVPGIAQAADHFVYGWGGKTGDAGNTVFTEDEDVSSDADETGKTSSFPVSAYLGYNPDGTENDDDWNHVDARIVRYGAIGDTVWYDDDNDGIQNDKTGGVLKGVKDVTVNLYEDGNQVPIATTTTDANGHYLFATPESPDARKDTYAIQGDKKYVVEFDLSNVPGKEKLLWAKAHQPSNDAEDSDASEDVSRFVRRTPVFGNGVGMFLQVPVDLTEDAGVVTINNRLGDYFWFDEDGDGQQDEDAKVYGINGVTVTLVDKDDNTVQGVDASGKLVPMTTTTAPKADGTQGWYEFENIIPGEGYRVKFTRPGDLADLSAHMAADPLTATLRSVPSAYRFTKPNVNGAAPVADDSDAAFNATGAALAVTDLNGYSAPINVTPLYGNGEANDQWDTWDAGIERNLTNYVGDRVWLDLNRNGKMDSDEIGINGLTVTLYSVDASGVKTQVGQPTTTADASKIVSTVEPKLVDNKSLKGAGYYYFEKLLPGKYTVEFTLPEDGKPIDGFDATYASHFSFVWTDPGAGTDPFALGETGDSDAIAQANTRKALSKNFDMASTTQNLNVDAGVCLLSSLGDYVWFDANRNGIQDSNEYGAPGVSVTLQKLVNGSWADQGSKTTDADGKYWFDKLEAGTYRVIFNHDAAFPRANYGLTLQYANGSQRNNETDSDPSNGSSNYGYTANIDLAWGEVNPTIDAGIVVIDQNNPPPPPPPPPTSGNPPPSSQSQTPYSQVNQSAEDVPYGPLKAQEDDVPYGMIKTGQGVQDLMLALGLGLILMGIGFSLLRKKKQSA